MKSWSTLNPAGFAPLKLRESNATLALTNNYEQITNNKL